MTQLAAALAHAVHHSVGHRELLAAAAAVLRTHITYDVAIWATLDPATCLPTGVYSGDGYDFDKERLEQIVRYEHETTDPGGLVDLLQRPQPVFALRADVDDPLTVTRYRDVLAPLGSYDEARVALVDERRPWGMCILHRGEHNGAFGADEIATLATMSPVLGRALRLAFLRAASQQPGGIPDPPGQVIVSAGGTLVDATASAARWIDVLGGADSVALTVAGLKPAIDATGAAYATLATDDGPVTVHISLMGDGGDIAVLLERPREPALSGAITAAYGLSPREREIAELVLGGQPTKRIAATLGITPYTVQDHLKAIFTKTETGNRAELQWKLSSRFYLPAAAARRTPGPYGYYLESEHVARVLDESA